MGDSVPTVFISSTIEDLKEYRAAARDAAVRAGFLPVMLEDFCASGAEPPLDTCLAKAKAADVVVAIVAQRSGWKPPRHTKSITRLECEQAAELLVFVVDPSVPWPLERTEAYRLIEAHQRGRLTPKLPAAVKRDEKLLADFRAWLNTNGIRNTFTNPDDLRGKVEGALRAWRERHRTGGPHPPPPQDPRLYLESLAEQTRYIDIRGLQVGTGKAYRFPITDLYIPLTTATAGDPRLTEERERRPTRLEETLTHSRLVIIGDPGSGKTTFLRWLVQQRTHQRGDDPQQPLPILIRIAELAEHIGNHSGTKGCPTRESNQWLLHFLAAKSQALTWGLDAQFFQHHLTQGTAALFLDGLDEAPSSAERASIARIFENATLAYKQCRIVVTTRPQSYAGTALLAGFTEARIEPLDEPAVQQFLTHWGRALFPTSEAEAKAHVAGLRAALHAKTEIRRMVANPVMLTALAVVHWNEKRIPEQRAELYESVLQWLARSREQRPGRASATRCLELLRLLALAMQDHPQGRKTELSLGESAALLAPEYDGSRAAAELFLSEEEADSGIIVRRDTQLRFWHLTFQEYCAARRIAGFGDAQMHALLIAPGKIYRPEWRETALLLAGVLMGQGRERVDGLIAALLDHLGPKAKLPQQAPTAALLGAIVADLRPFGYEPKDPRYPHLMDAVLGVFTAQSVTTIDFQTRLEAAEALGQAGDPRLGDKPENWITLDHKFQIARYPVTVQEYRHFIEDTGHPEPGKWAEQLAHPNRPVVYVSWHDASAYAQWAGARLLTEAEWQRAACGVEGRTYPWGEAKPDAQRANYASEGKPNVGHATPAGLYPLGATPEGIQDLAGNVWEWCQDWYDKDEKWRVGRGGSWGDHDTNLPGAIRDYNRPDDRSSDSGFRVGRELPSP